MTEEDLVRLYRRGTARETRGRDGCVSLEALLAVVEKRGTENERLRAINHAMACAECAEELELLRATRVVRDRARVPNIAFALAASVLLAAGQPPARRPVCSESSVRNGPEGAGSLDPWMAAVARWGARAEPHALAIVGGSCKGVAKEGP